MSLLTIGPPGQQMGGGEYTPMRRQASSSGAGDPDTYQASCLIEDYLDHLCAPLVGVVPFPIRSELRSDAADMLEQLQNQYLLEGLPLREATSLAIRKHGSSQEAGMQFLETWFAHQKQGKVGRFFGMAYTHALVHFGTATLLAVGLVELRVFRPCYDYILSYYLSPAEVRQLIPEPLPLPDTSPLQVALIVVALVAPVVAGYLTGAAVPVRAVRTVCHVLIPLILFTSVLGAMMLPTREGLFLAACMLFYWLPAGCLAAHISSALAWQRRCRYPL
ncbi:MAG: hypothetical protein H8F28_01015 [Fibrella sp.]|nr:hypothetical protein [Armatimonadota bacterium]